MVDLDVEETNDFVFLKRKAEKISEQYKMMPEWDKSKYTLCGLCSKVCNYHAIIQSGTYIPVFENLCHSCQTCLGLCPNLHQQE